MIFLVFLLIELIMWLWDCLFVVVLDELVIVICVCVVVGLGIILGFKM